jgi:hypothetical protein
VLSDRPRCRCRPSPRSAAAAARDVSRRRPLAAAISSVGAEYRVYSPAGESPTLRQHRGPVSAA